MTAANPLAEGAEFVARRTAIFYPGAWSVPFVAVTTPFRDLMTKPDRAFDRIRLGIGAEATLLSKIPARWPLRPLTPTVSKPRDNALGFIIEGRVGPDGTGRHR